MVVLVLPRSTTKSSGKRSKKDDAPTKSSEVSHRVDQQLLTKAVQALLKHHQNKKGQDGKEQLLGTDTSIQVQISLEVAPTSPSRKPILLHIPHPMYHVSNDDEQNCDNLDTPEVCLFVKTESKAEVKEMIGKFPDQMGFVKKVMGLDSLRKKYAQYSQRRELLKQYSVFMVDDRILPMMTQSLGRDFIKAKKHPIPVKITRKTTLPLNIVRALSSTCLHLASGNCVNIRAGYTNMPADHLVENILAVLENGVSRIPRKWANIRAVSIKTPDSTSLPFYNKTPSELAEIARLSGLSQVGKDDNANASHSPSQDDSDEKESPRKRKESKSPLLHALKKQRTDDVKVDAATKTASKNAATDQLEQDKKSKQKKKRDEKTAKTKDEKTSSEKRVSSKKKEESGSEKKSFIASAVFGGSRKGYVFRKGPNGVGYYTDVKPVPNKAALAALSRKSSHNHKSSGRKKRRSH